MTATHEKTGKTIIAVGHAALDYVYRIPAFPPAPTKIRALEHIASGGGMAANAAAAIAKLGGKVTLLSRIGDDATGGIIRQQLERAGVDTAFLRSIAGIRSPTAAVIVDERGERLVVSEDDHTLPLTAEWLPLSYISTAAAVLSDLTWLEGTEAAFGTARRQGIATVLDVDLGSGELIEKVIGMTDYAIFSAPAFARFIKGSDDQERLKSLVDRGVRYAGVTLGAGGFLWRERQGSHGHQAAYPVAVVDTTGAGDAFHGAFTWALAEGLSHMECARIASAVAALNCRRLGARAGLPTRSELDDFLFSLTTRGPGEA